MDRELRWSEMGKYAFVVLFTLFDNTFKFLSNGNQHNTSGHNSIFESEIGIESKVG